MARTSKSATVIVQCKLSAEPKGRAAAIVHLPIGSSVKMQSRQDNWLHVLYTPDGSVKEFSGWILKENVAEE